MVDASKIDNVVAGDEVIGFLGVSTWRIKIKLVFNHSFRSHLPMFILNYRKFTTLLVEILLLISIRFETSKQMNFFLCFSFVFF
jgi:hypothetical protein